MRITDTLSPVETPGFDAWISEVNQLDFALGEVYDLDGSDSELTNFFDAGFSPIETLEDT